MEQLTEGTFENFNQISRFIPPGVKKLPTTRPTKPAPTTVPSSSSKIFQTSFLPKGYEIIDTHINLPRNACVTLPQGHRVICHGTRTVVAINAVLTFLFCAKPSTKSDPSELYVIYFTQDRKSHAVIIDAAAADFRNGKLILVKFLVKNMVADQMRYPLPSLQRLLNIVMPNKHFDNPDLLTHLVKYRRYIYSCMCMHVYMKA
jgi:hypothetical protein